MKYHQGGGGENQSQNFPHGEAIHYKVKSSRSNLFSDERTLSAAKLLDL